MDIEFHPGHILEESFRLDEIIGYGSFGQVWKGWHLHLDKLIAIKIIDTYGLDITNLARVERECKIVGKLGNVEGIAQVYHAFRDQNHLFLIMEFMELGSLDKYLKTDKPDLEQAVSWAHTLCNALQSIHNHQIIHRDIKPQNILLNEKREIKLCDFGVAYLPDSQITQTQPGTPDYKAPELGMGSLPDERTDVYSLCAVFFYMFSGKSYFPLRNQTNEVIKQELFHWLHENYPSVDNLILTKLEALILGGLEQNPDHRVELRELKDGFLDVGNLLGLKKADVHSNLNEGRSNPKPLKNGIFLVPYPQNKIFWGRDEDLKYIHTIFQNTTDAKSYLLLLSGLGGVGKTQLAVEYAYRFKEFYPNGIFWINASNSWTVELAELAGNSGFEAAPTQDPDRQKRLAKTLLDYLSAHTGALLIFDNVEDPRLLQVPIGGVIPSQLPCRILITTRSRKASFSFELFEIHRLSEEAAIRILLSSSSRGEILNHWENGHISNSRISDAQTICRSLGCFPLALVLAAAYLNKFSHVSLSDYLFRLKAEGGLATLDAAEVDPLDLPTRHDASITATLKSQMAVLKDDNALRALQTAALFPESELLSRTTLSLFSGLSDISDWVGHPPPLEQALLKLRDLWLVEDLNECEIRIHPLIREYVIQNISNRHSFTISCINAIVDTLWQPTSLNYEILARGIDAISVDLQIARRWASNIDPDWWNDSKNFPKLFGLCRIIDLESHNLRQWDPFDESGLLKNPLLDPHQTPGYLLQQLRNRALKSRFQDIAFAYDLAISSKGYSCLCERFTTLPEAENLEYTLLGHTDLIQDIVITNDNRYIFSSSEDGSIIQWDLNTGKFIDMVLRYENWPLFVAVTPENHRAISNINVWKAWANKDNLFTSETKENNFSSIFEDRDWAISVLTSKDIQIWDTQAGIVIKDLMSENSFLDLNIHEVHILNKGEKLIYSTENSVVVWDLDKGIRLYSLPPKAEKFQIKCFTVTPDEAIFITGDDSGTISYWDSNKGKLLRQMKGHQETVTHLQVASAGSIFISSSRDGTLKAWDIVSGSEIRSFIGHRSWVNDFIITPDGRRIVSASSDCTIRIWNLEDEHVQILLGHTEPVTRVVISPDGNYLVSCSLDRTLKIWSPGKDFGNDVLDNPEAQFNHVLFSNDGQKLIIYGNELTINDVEPAPEGFAQSNLLDEFIYGAVISLDNSQIITCSHSIKLWDFNTRELIKTLLYNDDENRFFQSVTPDCKKGVAYIVNNMDQCWNMEIWDIQKRFIQNKIVGEWKPPGQIAITPQGNFIVATSLGILCTWDINNNYKKRIIIGKKAPANNIAITKDGRRAIVSYLSLLLSEIELWDIETDKRLLAFPSKQDVVALDIAITPDDRFAVILYSDHSLQFWDLSNKKCKAILPGSFTSMAITFDGSLIVAIDHLGDVHFLDCVNMD